MKTKASNSTCAVKRGIGAGQLEEQACNKRRSVEIAAPASRTSIDSGRSSFSHNDAFEQHSPSSSSLFHRSPSEHPSTSGAAATGAHMRAQPCLGVPATEGAAGHQQSKAPAKKPTSAPAIGVPMATPSGFGLPFMPPPLLFFWMQQLAVQQSMAYMQQQQMAMMQQPIAPSSSGASASPPPPAPHTPWPMPPAPPPCFGDASLFGSTNHPSIPSTTMPPPPPGLTGMPAFPPPPMPLPPLPPHMELPPPPPVPAELVGEGASLQGVPPQKQQPAPAEQAGLLPKGKHSIASCGDGTADAAAKADCGSSDSSDGDSSCADTDFAAFIDSFLSGPDTLLPSSGSQGDLLNPDSAPLSLLMCKPEAEDVLELLRSSSAEEAQAAAACR